MKKVIGLILAVVMCVSVVALSACGAKEIEPPLNEVITQMYQTEGLNKDFQQWSSGNFGLATNPVDKDNIEAYLGVKTDVVDGYESAPMMLASAYSLVVVKVKDGVDMNKLKEDVKANAPINKWICVSVNKDQVFVETRGNVLMLLMVRCDKEEGSVSDPILTRDEVASMIKTFQSVK